MIEHECFQALCLLVEKSDHENNQQDALYRLLFHLGFTCFGRCFRPSSGALDCIYSIW